MMMAMTIVMMTTTMMMMLCAAKAATHGTLRIMARHEGWSAAGRLPKTARPQS